MTISQNGNHIWPLSYLLFYMYKHVNTEHGQGLGLKVGVTGVLTPKQLIQPQVCPEVRGPLLSIFVFFIGFERLITDHYLYFFMVQSISSNYAWESLKIKTCLIFYLSLFSIDDLYRSAVKIFIVWKIHMHFQQMIITNLPSDLNL